MFYAAELLSRKSKSEISILYYLSTAESLKKIPKHEILALDFASVIEKIQTPKVPFALRLYSYLLKGIVRIWKIKAEFYALKAKGIFFEKNIKRFRESIRKVDENVNLRVLDFVLGDSYINSSLNRALYDVNSIIVPGTDHCGSFSTNNEACSLVPEYYSSSCSIENKRGSGISLSNSINILGSSNDANSTSIDFVDNEIRFFNKVKRIKQDKVTEYKTEEIYGNLEKILKVNIQEFQPHTLHDSVVTTVIDSFILFKKSFLKADNSPQFDIDISLEEPRVSSSISQDVDYEKEVEFNLNKSSFTSNHQAERFYNLLIEASLGQVIVEQPANFGPIKILDGRSVRYFS